MISKQFTCFNRIDRIDACLLLATCLLLTISSCGGGGGSEVASNDALIARAPDISHRFFDPSRLIAVDIELAPNQYKLLRQEGRNTSNLVAGCGNDFAYSHFEAKVSIDGTVLDRVDIRKKGYFGSLSASRPSFKLNFTTHSPFRVYQSMERMTLNNNRQDRSATHQCVSYKLFRDAGLVAPRCNFAKVTVNGQYLGIYSNVESIKEPFLSRNFDNAGGNLYESQLAAFAPHGKNLFQLKTNQAVNDRSDLEAVVRALQADDDNLPGLLEQEINIDQFIDFWALEILTGHWDGAAGNTNNYYIYRNPDDGLFSFIPWGTDGTFYNESDINTADGPLWHFSPLSNRLFEIPIYKEKLFARLDSMMESSYQLDDIHSEMDRIQILTDSDLDSVAGTKAFANELPEQIRLAMAGSLEDNTVVKVDRAPNCDLRSTEINGSFGNGVGSFSYVNFQGEQITATASMIRGPINDAILDNTNPATETFNLIALVEGRFIAAVFTVEKPEFKPGTTVFHGIATTLFLVDTAPDGDFAISSVGEIVFESTEEDLSGSFSATVVLNNRFLEDN